MTANWYEQQLKNNNYLSPIGFKFFLEKSPKASFLCQTANIPELTLGTPEIATPFIPFPIEGNLRYGSFAIKFLVDEDLQNYLELHNWMRALGVPDGYLERRTFEDAVKLGPQSSNTRNLFSDGTLQILNNNFNFNFEIVFQDLIPTSLSTLDFDVTESDNNFLTATAIFAYTIYEIRNSNGERIEVSSWNP
jgi:hypothetical protein